MHRCRRLEESPDSGGGTAAAPQGQVVCRSFIRQGDLKRPSQVPSRGHHKCPLEAITSAL